MFGRKKKPESDETFNYTFFLTDGSQHSYKVGVYACRCIRCPDDFCDSIVFSDVDEVYVKIRKSMIVKIEGRK